MKFTKLSVYAMLAAGTVFVSSCKKKDTTTTDTPIVYTSEQNKANLQQSGLDMLNQMNDAKDMKTIDNAINFVNLMDQSNPFETVKPQSILPLKVMYALRDFRLSGDQVAVYSALREAKSLEDDTTLEMAFNDIKGTYTWNETDKKWDKAEGADLVLKFPATKTATTNNATYTVQYTPYTGAVLAKELEGNTPQKIVAKLEIDGLTLTQFNFDGAYNSDGVPNRLEANLRVENYNFNTLLILTAPKVAYSYAFTHNAKNILAMGTTLTGNFTKAHLESLNDKSVERPEDLTKVATSMNAYIQVLNVKLDGNANVQGLSNDLTAAGGSDKLDNKQKWVDILNKNLTLKAFYTDRNATIGHSEFYVKPYTNTYTTYEFNPNTQQYEEVTKTESGENIDLRLVFEDASKADLETYFSTGFDKVQNDFTQFLKDLESRYGSKEEAK
jgi:hypothetical protein